MNMNTAEQTRDTVAKLLAEENISVVRTNVRTASFDTNGRVLSLPIWKDVTAEVEEMLIAHEVAHALFTPRLQREDFGTTPFSYMNVLEDIRIEKLMKRKFPGLRRVMFLGYKQLNERNFFGIEGKDSSSLNFIDRINLWYKAGISANVKFNDNEREILYRAERTESFEDVMSLAKEVYEMHQEQKQKKQEQLEELRKIMGDDLIEAEGDGFEDYDEEELEFGSDDTDEGEEETQTQQPTTAVDDEAEEKADEEKLEVGDLGPSFDHVATARGEEEDDEVETMNSFEERLDELADTSVQYRYFNLDYCKEYNPVVGYKDVMKKLVHFTPGTFRRQHTDETFIDADFVAFRSESMRVVNYLVKEFEMRKSAAQYKRSSQSKSGMLDPSKLFAFKTSEDLFKRITVVPDGKNHGMVFLLDWSGSMYDCIFDTVKQVINLAMFCHRVQIPFHVFAFSSGVSVLNDEAMVDKYRSWYQLKYAERYNRAETDTEFNTTYDSFTLLEFFNHRMSSQEFNLVAKHLLSFLFYMTKNCRMIKDLKNEMTNEESETHSRIVSELSLGSTPLNESLVYMVEEFVPKFIKQNSIEKFTFMTLSDGQGGNLATTSNYSFVDGQRVRLKHFVRDAVSKKSHRFEGSTAEITAILNQMMRDRYGAKTIGFFVTPNRQRCIESAIRDNVVGAVPDILAIRSDIRKEGVALMKVPGRDEFFLMQSSKASIEEDNIEVTSDMSAAVAARGLTKYLNKQKTSRVLLNRFVGLVA